MHKARAAVFWTALDDANLKASVRDKQLRERSATPTESKGRRCQVMVGSRGALLWMFRRVPHSSCPIAVSPAVLLVDRDVTSLRAHQGGSNGAPSWERET
ncbi:hypothetical protein GW17_00054991 [Ensete ventricosum]|nr:hypothetical protein GW17_00054991 [Ensete ventricosum]